MSFEAVLGNKEFELVVFGVTFQGLPEVNEFLFIHPKPQCLHIVYTIITAIPTRNFRFL
jgi:hypothetical protein